MGAAFAAGSCELGQSESQFERQGMPRLIDSCRRVSKSRSLDAGRQESGREPLDEVTVVNAFSNSFPRRTCASSVERFLSP